jgi:cleavage and polyadenylation specificity factor subunit 1
MTADALGGITTLVPLKAARFKRLQLLQGQLTRSVQHVAGLNPKAFRCVSELEFIFQILIEIVIDTLQTDIRLVR